jgi:glutathione peroxidase
MKNLRVCLAAAALAALGLGLKGAVAIEDHSHPQKNAATKTTKNEVPPVLNFTMKSLAGNDVNLSKYQGKVVLVVNTASKCGYTPQYAGLEALHKKYAAQGLAILGFPSNDFGHQEPGSDVEIGEFCRKNYGVEFDMFSKVPVTGAEKCPLYEYLTSAKTDPKFPGEVQWNFEKFLIGRDGEILNRFRSKVAPDAPELVQAVEAALAQK